MKIYKQRDIDNYMKQDWIMQMLQSFSDIEAGKVKTNEWLMTDVNKRMIYADVYGDIIDGKQRKKVLDIGGGVSALTKVLAQKSEYTLVDILAHGGEEYIKQNKDLDINLKVMDWFMLEMQEKYDVVIANDIFPNVDQRMGLFIEKMLPHCRELRMILTYYNTPRFYVTQRVDAEEILTILCYDGEMVASKLDKYLSRLIDTEKEDLIEMRTDISSIYKNGRQVAYIRMWGSAK